MFLPRRTFFPVGLLAFFLFLFFLTQSPLQRVLESFLGGATTHLLGISSLFIRDVVSFSQTSALVAENRQLKERVMALEQSVSQLQEETRKTQRLVALEEHQKTLSLSGAVCRVVGRDPNP